jgi:hypothetical protein
VDKVGTVEVGVEVDTSQIDEAIEKTGEFVELRQDLVPHVSIRNARNCTFNITIGGADAEAR